MFRLLALFALLLIGYAIYRLVGAVRDRKAALAWERHRRERDARWAQMLAERDMETPPPPGETHRPLREEN